MGLSEYDNMYENADGKQSSGGSLMDGNYTAGIVDIKFGYTTNKGTPNVSWTLVVTEGNMKGRYLFKNSYLNNKNGINAFKREHTMVGIELKKLSDVETNPELLEAALGKIVELRVKTKGDFTNVDFKKFVASSTVEAIKGGSTVVEDDDEVPF